MIAAIEVHITLGVVVVMLGLLLNQHRVWVRVKDRLNTLWDEYCDQKKIPYTSLDNGNK